MKVLLEKLSMYASELLLGPERFREVLVMLFTGVGEAPQDLARLFIAWFTAVLIADRVFSKRRRAKRKD